MPRGARLRMDVAEYVSLRTRSRMEGALEALRDPAGVRLFLSDLAQAVAFGPVGVRRLLACVARVVAFRQGLQILCGADMGKRTWLYSYWLGHAALAAALASAGTGAACVSRAHGADLYRERCMPPYLPLQRQTIQRLDRVFVVSEHGVRYLQAVHGDRGGRVLVSRLGVPARDSMARHSEDGTLHLLSCSYAVPVKRLDLLAKALGLCDFPVRWTHIGSGPTLDGVKAIARRLPPNAEARFLGSLSNRDVIRYYETEAVDLFVNVSLSEGVPVSIMEALSFGVPVVATAVGGVPELVGEETGYLLARDVTAAQVAAVLGRFWAAPLAEKARLRRGSLAKWRELANADTQYEGFVAALKATTKASNARGDRAPCASSARRGAAEEDRS